MSQKKSEPWIGPLVVSWDVWRHELAVDPLSHVGLRGVASVDLFSSIRLPDAGLDPGNLELRLTP